MKRNILLEERQKKGLNPIVAKYQFTVTCKGQKATSPVLNVIDKGIKLRFLRYALFDNNNFDELEFATSPDRKYYILEQYRSIFTDNEQAQSARIEKQKVNESDKKDVNFEDETILLDEIALQPKEIPSLKNYSVASAPLREGFLYLINAKDPQNDIKEYKVDDSSGLRKILFADNLKEDKTGYKDTRKATGLRIKCIVLEEPTKYHMAYSPVQWKISYINELANNATLRKERMTLINCNGFKKGEPNNNGHAQPYNEVKIALKKGDTNEYYYKNTLHRICADERNSTDDLLQDMFITLHDPIGCANTIGNGGIEREIIRLQSIIGSLPTGKDPKKLFNQIKNNESITINDDEKAQETYYLHRLAQLTYDYIGNKENHSIKYASRNLNGVVLGNGLASIPHIYSAFIEQAGVSFEKLEKILAVKERQEQRAIINSYRNDLGNLLISDFYQNALDNYTNSIDASIETAKEVTAEHLLYLGSYPNRYDRHLDLHQKYKIEQDKWYNYINETLYNDSPKYLVKSTNILNMLLTFKMLEVVSIGHKTNNVVRKIIKAYAEHGNKGEFPYKIHRKISYFVNPENRKIVFRFRALENFDQYLLEQRKQLTNELEKGKTSLRKYQKHWHLEYEKISRQTAEELIKDGKVVLNLKNKDFPFKKTAEEIFKSGIMGSLIVLIESIFWIEALKKMQKESTLSSGLELGGASIKLGAALHKLADERDLYERYFAEGISEKMSNIGKGIGVLSSAITVASAAKSMYMSFENRDADAGIAFGVATALSSVFLVADFSAFMASVTGVPAFFALTFWQGFLLGGGLLLTLGLIIKFLNDNQLAYYFKNFPLSDYALPPTKTETPLEYVQRLIVQRKQSITQKAQEKHFFKSYQHAFAYLTDLLHPTKLTTEILVNKEFLQKAISGKNSMGVNKHNSFIVKAKQFKINLYSMFFCEEINDLDVQAFLYPNGLEDKSKKIEITTFFYEFLKPKITYSTPSSIEQPICNIEFMVSENYVQDFFSVGQIIFRLRIRTGNNEYSPTELPNMPRYIYTCINLYQTFDAVTASYVLPIFGEPETKYLVAQGTPLLKLKGTDKDNNLLHTNIFSATDLNLLETYGKTGNK